MNKKASQYLSVGIDIGADFSLMAIALPSQELVGSPYRIVHKSQRSLNGAIDRIYTLMKHYDLPARVYMESTGIYHFPNEPDKICGYSVYTSAFAPELEKGKPAIAFGDFSYYNIGDRGTRSFQELRELFAGNGMIGYVAKERVDGKLILPEAVQILHVKASA